ncbi:MAG TPA: XdhC family protein [Steroidobacteraceae bacterium]|nr:XdhC family protein [Steroidobacteraceae bacterium]
MEAELTPLLPLCERERAASRAFALAVVVATSGSTYRKPGALMAIAADGTYAGLLSGGCLESDLREHAAKVIETGTARTVRYETGGEDDALWGLGVGCEGAMQVLLLRVGPEERWQPLEHLAGALAEHRRTAIALVADSKIPDLPTGRALLPGAVRVEDSPEKVPAGLSSDLSARIAELLERTARSGEPGWLEASAARFFGLPLALPPRLLLLGGGPDAMPVVDFAARLAWKVTVYDHRPSYAQTDHFPAAARVVLGRPEELDRTLELGAYEAAVVMSHHLPSDLEYLRVLARAQIPYVGLLGPPHRRERLLADLGDGAQRFGERLRAPVGLDLGGRTPEAIALAIVAEIHAWLHHREGGLFEAERRWRAHASPHPA